MRSPAAAATANESRDIVTTLGHVIGTTTDLAWDTWWARLLGSTITGSIEVFTPEEKKTKYLGGDGYEFVTDSPALSESDIVTKLSSVMRGTAAGEPAVAASSVIRR